MIRYFFSQMPPRVLTDLVVLPPGHGSSVTDFWGWDAYELYCTVLYCTVLYWTVQYCTVLYCTVLRTKVRTDGWKKGCKLQYKLQSNYKDSSEWQSMHYCVFVWTDKGASYIQFETLITFVCSTFPIYYPSVLKYAVCCSWILYLFLCLWWNVHGT